MPRPDTHTAAAAFLADVEDALAQAAKPVPAIPTSYRNNTLPDRPTIGTTPPIAHQPGGRAPMSQEAVDYTAKVLATSVASVPIGGVTALVIYALGHTDPANLAIGGAIPTVLVLAIARLVKRGRQALEAAPREIHQHYTGPVHQEHKESHTTIKGVLVKNHTEEPK